MSFSKLVLVRFSVFLFVVYSAAVMLFSRLELFRVSAFVLPVSAAVLLFLRLVLVRFSPDLRCACTPLWMFRNKTPFRLSMSVTSSISLIFERLMMQCSRRFKVQLEFSESFNSREGRVTLWRFKKAASKSWKQWVEYQLKLFANQQTSKQ